VSHLRQEIYVVEVVAVVVVVVAAVVAVDKLVERGVRV